MDMAKDPSARVDDMKVAMYWATGKYFFTCVILY